MNKKQNYTPEESMKQIQDILDRTDFSIDGSLNMLDNILDQMEKENLPLEKAFLLYEQGVQIAKNCREQINGLEQKVQLISENGEVHDFEG